MKIKQNILEYIKNNSYNGYIDKSFVSKFFDVSERTAERRIKELGFKHMSSKNICMMIDICNAIPSIDIARKYECSLANVNAFARRHNLSGRYNYNHKNYEDPEYFSSIDTEEKAYILGFIAADGHVSDKEIIISLSTKDIDIIEKIKSSIGINKDIKFYTGNSFNSNKESKFARFAFGTKEMISSLRSLGFVRDKTVNFRIPEIDSSLYRHFIRGYMDGDGSFGKYLHNDGYYRSSMTICGTEEFLLGLMKIFNSMGFSTSKKLKKRFNTENCCYELALSGNDNVLKVLNYLYLDSNIYLDRKYENFLSMAKSNNKRT